MWARVLKDFVVSALIFAPLAAQARAAVELETELDAVTEIRPDFNPALAADLDIRNRMRRPVRNALAIAYHPIPRAVIWCRFARCKHINFSILQ